MNDAADVHWGVDAIDPKGPNLPALKARFLLDHVPERGSVVEIGCGEGKLLRTIARRRPGLDLHGCDVREPRTPPDVFTFRRIENGLPYASASMDAVLLFDVLEHVPDPAGTIAEAARILRPGGRLVAFVPVEGEPASFYSLFRLALGADTYARTKEHIQAFRHRELRELVERRFELLEVRYAYHLLGQAMDASFFAAARLPFVRNFWWKDNVYYNAQPKKQSASSRVLNLLLEAGNFAAWLESTLLASVRTGSAGVLLVGELRHPTA